MLSNNPHVKFWVDQFNVEDRQLAKEFLDELEYVSKDKLISEIEAALIDIIEGSSKVAILPVRELFFDGECYYPQDLSEIKAYLYNQNVKIDTNAVDSIVSKSSGKEITKKDIEGVNPIFQDPINQPGSEALISNLITQLKRRYPSKVVTGRREKNPSISDLRKEKCRKLILVDDVIGSGQRMYDFLVSITKNKTINSWVSGGVMELNVISFMKSEKSEDKLRRIKPKFNVKFIDAFPTFFDIENRKVAQYVKLIEKYSDKREKMPFGYDKTFGRAIFEHSVPNNTPAILWRDQTKWRPNGKEIIHQGKWMSLFSGRSINLEIKQGIRKNADPELNNRAKITLVLKALRDEGRVNTSRQLSRYLGWDIAICKEIVARLKINSFIDEQSNMTALGLAELNYLEANQDSVEFNSDNYYPDHVMG